MIADAVSLPLRNLWHLIIIAILGAHKGYRDFTPETYVQLARYYDSKNKNEPSIQSLTQRSVDFFFFAIHWSTCVAEIQKELNPIKPRHALEGLRALSVQCRGESRGGVPSTSSSRWPRRCG